MSIHLFSQEIGALPSKVTVKFVNSLLRKTIASVGLLNQFDSSHYSEIILSCRSLSLFLVKHADYHSLSYLFEVPSEESFELTWDKQMKLPKIRQIRKTNSLASLSQPNISTNKLKEIHAFLNSGKVICHTFENE